jgi:NitT/TauT family transport system ATP-binding protein
VTTPARAISARDISKVFFSAAGTTVALNHVSLDVDPGEFVCILGPSGCGKSTLLRVLGGLETATAGDVVLASEDRPAFVFQEHGVFPWYTVLENVAFGLRMNGVGRRSRIATAREWIHLVGLGDFEDAYPHNLSGGMRQRTAIARAFATGSDLLLMDEPLGALDAQTRQLMQELLIDLWEKERKTVVLVTHSIEEAILLGDRVVMMSARPGRIRREIEVPFPRPRSMELEASAEFAEMRYGIWNDLRDEVMASEEAGA